MKKYIYAVIIAAVTTVSCQDKEGCTDSTAHNYDSEAEKNCCCEYHEEHAHVDFTFSHKVGAEALVFDDMKYVSDAGHKYDVKTLKYFISNIKFRKAGGVTKSFDKVYYVDAEDATTLTWNANLELDHGTYDSICFTIGIDSATNKAGLFTDAPEVNMEWPMMMGSGYHYMKLEGAYDSASVNIVTKNYNLHTGQSMGTPYNIDVCIAKQVTATADFSVGMTMDIAEWLKNPTSYDFDTYGMMIMGNASAQQVLQDNGADVFSVEIE